MPAATEDDLFRAIPSKEGLKILENSDKYPFGIYTVYANKRGSTPEYHIMRNAATWARPRLRKAVRESIVKEYLNGRIIRS